MTSVEDILDYKKKDEEDFYAILGCDENSSIEQITAEYKVRALQLHPDKNEGNKEAEQKFQLLKQAKEILCDPEKKNNYDKWRNSGIAISYKQWLGMKEHVHQSMHWSTPKTKDRMLESGDHQDHPVSGQEMHRRRTDELRKEVPIYTGVAAVQGRPGARTHQFLPKSPLKPKQTKPSGGKPSHVKPSGGKPSGGSSGPSSLTTGALPASYRRASEGGANLFNKERKNNESTMDKTNEI